MNNTTIFAWTQSILALVVVVGCGVLMSNGVIDGDVAAGIIGVVLGYFFGTGVDPVPFKQRNGKE